MGVRKARGTLNGTKVNILDIINYPRLCYVKNTIVTTIFRHFSDILGWTACDPQTTDTCDINAECVQPKGLEYFVCQCKGKHVLNRKQ